MIYLIQKGILAQQDSQQKQENLCKKSLSSAIRQKQPKDASLQVGKPHPR